MADIQKYMLDKISEFKSDVCNPEAYLHNMVNFDKELKRMWERDKGNFDYAGIVDNEKVFDYVERFEGIVSFKEKCYVGCSEDTYEMYFSLYKVFVALNKMAKNFENSHCQFEEISIQRIDEIFDKLEELVRRMENVNMRRAMQV